MLRAIEGRGGRAHREEEEEYTGVKTEHKAEVVGDKGQEQVDEVHDEILQDLK